ncbi:fumarate hydratase [Thermodesulfobacteriota bacterium]
MKEIQAEAITETVARLCQEANFYLGQDVLTAFGRAEDEEVSESAREVIGKLIENAEIAAAERIPLCQDCGAAVVFVDVGQDAHIVGGDMNEAIAAGVRNGYEEGYLRKSMVLKPFSERVNTRDNTPPIIHTRIVAGDKLSITVAPKGGGSENMSKFTVLKPAQGRKGVIDFVVKTVEEAGGNPCPPLIIGVGIGGTGERCFELAKRSLLREVGSPSSDAEVAELETELLQRINALGIGPQGFGGRTTALAVHVETFPSHIASMPVAVNIQCHSARHKEAIL